MSGTTKKLDKKITRYLFEYLLIDDEDTLPIESELLQYITEYNLESYIANLKYGEVQTYELIRVISELSSEKDAVSIILDLIELSEFDDIYLLGNIIKELRHYHSLPYNLLKRIEKLPENSEQIFKHFFIYSLMYLFGYTLPIHFDELAANINLNYVKYKVWMESTLPLNEDIFSEDIFSEGIFSDDIFNEDGVFEYPTIFDIVNEVIPLNRYDGITKDENLYNSPKKIKFPLKKVLADLDTFFENEKIREDFKTQINKYSDLVDDASLKKLVNSIENQFKKGNFGIIVKKFKKIDLLSDSVSKNPVILFLKERAYSNDTKMYENPTYRFYNSYKILEMIITSTLEKPKLEYYLETALLLEVMGYFWVSLIICLKLLKFLPMDPQLHLIAGYSSYQLFKDYKYHLYRGSIVDPGRIMNFLEEFWPELRFKPQDTLTQYEMTEEQIDELYKDFETQWKKEPFEEISNHLNLEIFGRQFPFKELFGFDIDYPNTYREETLSKISHGDREFPDDVSELIKLKEKFGNGVLDFILGNDMDFDEKKYFDIDYYEKDNEDSADDEDNEGNKDSEDVDEMDNDDIFTSGYNIVLNQGDRWFNRIASEWIASDYYNSLPKYTSKSKDSIPRLALILHYEEHQTLPENWKWNELKKTLLDSFPKRVEAPKYYFKSIGKTMQGFCNFLVYNKKMANLEDFPDNIKKVSNTIIENSGKPEFANFKEKYFEI